MSVNSSIYDLEQIKQQISVPQVLTLFSHEIGQDGKIRCLWHNDTGSPNMHVYDDHAYCFSCGKYADIFSFIMKLGKMSMDRAVEWLLERKHILPQSVVRKAPKEYLGPLPINIAKHYHDQLDTERRQYLYDRLITDETIDRYLIGYRGDYQAYTIPFWEDIPGNSDIVALQYRAAPWSNNPQKKYWWEPGRYKPCLFNQHLINHLLVIVVFGTLDALVGAQDGLPMVSASGLNTFANEKKMESVWLHEALRDVHHKIVLPDATVVEFEPAIKVMQGIGAEVKFFPYNAPGKDYNAYRISGRSTADFVKEILEMAGYWHNDHFYLIEPEHVIQLENMLLTLFEGKGPEARTMLLQTGKDAEVHSVAISHALQQTMGQHGPNKFNAPLSSEEWWEMIDNFAEAWESYTDLTEVVVKWHHRLEAKLGAF